MHSASQYLKALEGGAYIVRRVCKPAVVVEGEQGGASRAEAASSVQRSREHFRFWIALLPFPPHPDRFSVLSYRFISLLPPQSDVVLVHVLCSIGRFVSETACGATKPRLGVPTLPATPSMSDRATARLSPTTCDLIIAFCYRLATS